MKNSRFTVALTISLCLFFSATSVYSQGFYGNTERKETASQQSENTGKTGTSTKEASLLSSSNDGFPDLPGDPAATPVGEGLLLLTSLCGAYLGNRLWKNRNK